MAGDKDKDKKGFSGLSDLASEVSGIDEPIKPETTAEAKHSTPKPPPQRQREAATSEPDRKTTSSPNPIETVNSGNSGGSSGGKWLLGIVGVLVVIGLFNNDDKSYKKPSYNPQSSPKSYSYPQGSPTPSFQPPSTPQNAELQYTKPSVGTNNVLSLPEIRWCVRESIRIEAMRGVINTNAVIDKFNRTVNDYNSRCGSYRYRQGLKSRAEREVELYRERIASEAIREVRIPTLKPSSQNTRMAQQLLTNLGYNPGPIDGDYGRRTIEAVMAFQRDYGMTQDGWIDERLVVLLDLAVTARQ